MQNRCSNVSCGREATRYFRLHPEKTARLVGNELRRTCGVHPLESAFSEVSRHEYLRLLGIPFPFSVLVCLDPAEDLVPGGVYVVVRTENGRVGLSSVDDRHKCSRHVTHLVSRFYSLSEAYCKVCSGAKALRSFTYTVEGTPIDSGVDKQCSGCDGRGVSFRASEYRKQFGNPPAFVENIPSHYISLL